ncbi:MAG: hypothetical protein IPM82_16550 [Saprospiraceae bacterium]|nr:hypothetical protein [Saprospiraceae bacterium]
MNEVVVTAQVDQGQGWERTGHDQCLTIFAGGSYPLFRCPQRCLSDGANFAGVTRRLTAPTRHLRGAGQLAHRPVWRMEGVAFEPQPLLHPRQHGQSSERPEHQPAEKQRLSHPSIPLPNTENALSGVFDIELRSGNKENHEYTFQR